MLFVLPVGQSADQGDGAISELLVLGRRTQNADIRRTENDVQAYRIVTHQEIETAHRDNLDQFLRSREPANAQIRAPTQDPLGQPASTRSEIDLRGFGSQRTLVLVDGRRMPGLPTGQGEFDQSDLNAIPLGAIERVETLTSTAGGIHGPSAVGGVINVVLRRDYRGADFNVTAGASDRGDARRVRIEARIGFTPDAGDTDIMLFAAHAVSEPLLVGQRDLAERAFARAFANDPAQYLSRLPTGNAVSVYGFSDLTLDPGLGGTSLGADRTLLPVGVSGTDAQRTAALLANSGRVVLSPPKDNSGTRRYLLNNPTTSSGMFNLRRRFGADVEVFLDGLYLRNIGKLRLYRPNPPVATPGDAANNPFSQVVVLRFPTPMLGGVLRNETESYRVTTGVIANLPRRWKAAGDFTAGRAVVDQSGTSLERSAAFANALMTGVAASALPAVDPLGNWPGFLAALGAYAEVRSFK